MDLPAASFDPQPFLTAILRVLASATFGMRIVRMPLSNVAWMSSGAHRAGKRERALEGPVAALPQVVTALLVTLGALLVLLTADGEHVVLQLDGDVVVGHARELRGQEQLVLGLLDVDPRNPASSVAPRRYGRLVEHPGEPVGDLLQVAPGGEGGVAQGITRDGHGSSSLCHLSVRAVGYRSIRLAPARPAARAGHLRSPASPPSNRRANPQRAEICQSERPQYLTVVVSLSI